MHLLKEGFDYTYMQDYSCPIWTEITLHPDSHRLSKIINQDYN